MAVEFFDADAANLIQGLRLENRTIRYDKTTSRWPRLVLLDEYVDYIEALSPLSMTKFDKFECLLIGCYYLSHNISLYSTQQANYNKEKFVSNLEMFVKNSTTEQEYTTNHNGMSCFFFCFWMFCCRLRPAEHK